MSLHSWLIGGSPKPGSKRKLSEINDDEVLESPKKKFTKGISQGSFDWYKLDENNKWHCTVCRSANVDGAYNHGHEKPAKTTNHLRHAACKYLLVTTDM